MTTATLRELRHNFDNIEKAAKRGPVRITRRGRVIGTFTAERKAGKWTLPDRAARTIKTKGEVNVLDFLDR